MPGMLLVIGLLGTFLGLGLALNHASHILGQPDALTANGAADSMRDLVGLLQGLGTKFKTSTWGISGFVLLKFWSEITRFAEKRLAWVIGKVKIELEQRKQEEAVATAAKQKALFDEIKGAANGIVNGFAEQIARMAAHDDELHQGTQTRLDEHFRLVREDLGQVQAASRETNAAMTQFTSGVKTVVDDMGDAAARMASGADKVGRAAEQLTGSVDAFSAQFKDVLDSVRKDLGTAIKDMSTQASETLGRGSQQLESATREIASSLNVLSSDVKETLTAVKESIDKSLKMQTAASQTFTVSSDALNETIVEIKEQFDKLGSNISSGLQAVSGAGQHMRSIGKSLGDVIAPLTAISIEQKALFEPLGSLPAQQQAILRVLGEVRDNLASTSAAKMAANDEIVQPG
ncbi:hypothetical protein G3N95_31255 [Paraburkholderia sp. Tr-20389]|uniref:hypothetical protein n=1 Tax=Paraburkholderia sp. Tr-20389 TaxID=2703903 RepID=UPI00197CDDE5|nr:hypothetical protein [Paraburkholderia sp. Tr-20389]MBN3757447.1 hypothetical protein [Paraburkholderia sp. Tr-20389]